MSADELQAIAEREPAPGDTGDPGGDDVANDEAENGADPEPEKISPAAPELAMAFGVFFKVVGRIVHRRFGVDDFSEVEIEGLSSSAALVAAQYQIRIDPRAAAWIGFGLAVAGVAIPRLEAYELVIDGRVILDPAPEPTGAATDAAVAAAGGGPVEG